MQKLGSLTVEIDENILLQEMDDEAVLLNLNEERYFGLDDVGLRLWQLLQEHGNTEEVISQMEMEYNVSKETIHKDLGAFLIELENAGLIRVKAADEQ